MNTKEKELLIEACQNELNIRKQLNVCETVNENTI